MLRALVRRSAPHLRRPSPAITPTPTTTFTTTWSRSFAKKSTGKVAVLKRKERLAKQAGAAGTVPNASSPSPGLASEADRNAEKSRARRLELQMDEENPALDVGPNGRPLFTSSTTLSELSKCDVNTYFKFSKEKLGAVLREGLPPGMQKEFEDSLRTALLVRQSFLDLRDNFRRIVDPSAFASLGKASDVKKQIVLDGPRSGGKSIALAMLVHWAREEGWLVFYVPRGKMWTHGGLFYKNPRTGLWDTPVQATQILQDFVKCNQNHLQKLPCHILDPIPLGEGAGVGWLKGVDSMAVPEGSTLYDLIQIGLKHTHAAVGVVVRLREELSLVKDIPVLIAIDQYNNWFTFSEYAEVTTDCALRPIHSKELATVNAFRSMMHNDMMVGAFSHSTEVGKLRQDLPDVPRGARIVLPRYYLDEAAVVSHYYLRQRLVNREMFSEEGWKKLFHLAYGNGSEMRSLFPLMQA